MNVGMLRLAAVERIVANLKKILAITQKFGVGLKSCDACAYMYLTYHEE